MGERVETESDAEALAAAEAAELTWRNAQAAIEAKRLELAEVQRSEREARLAAKLAFDRAREVAQAGLAAAQRDREERDRQVTQAERVAREAKGLLDRRQDQAHVLRAAAETAREAATDARASATATAAQSASETEALAEAEARLQERRASLQEAEEALAQKREQAQEATRAAKAAADAAAEESAAIQAAHDAADKLEAKLEGLSAAIASAQAQVDAGEAAKAEAQREVDADQLRVDAATREVERTRSKAIEDSQAVGRAGSPEAMQVAAQQVMTSAQEQCAAEEALAQVTSDLEDARGSLALADKARRVAEDELGKAKSRFAAAQAECEFARSEAKALEEAGRRGRMANEAVRASKSAAEQRDLAEGTLKAIERDLLDLSSQVDTLRGSQAELEQRIASEQEAAEAAEAAAEQAEQEAREAAQEVTEAEQRLAAANEAKATAQAELDAATLLTDQRAALLERHDAASDDVEAAPDPAQADEAQAAEEAEVERIASESRDSWDLNTWGEEAEKEHGPPFKISCATPEQFLSDHEFRQDTVTIGRDESCDVVLDNPTISRRHAEIRRSEGLFALVDLGSPNGTYLNGKRVTGLTLLNDGDGIGMGKFRLTFSAQTEIALALQSSEAAQTGAELGDLTLRMLPSESRRVAGEFGRARGFIEVPQPNTNPAKVFISETFQIGKDPSCDLFVRRWFAPRKAAVIVRGFDRYLLLNVGPNAREVQVNGQPVGDRAVLKNGDAVTVCGYELRFTQENDSP